MVGVIEHALRCFPEECVGLLIGSGGDRPQDFQMRDEVSGFIPLSNVHPAPRQGFALDETEVALHVGKGVVGLYHSHPNGGGEPSLRDDATGFEFYWIVDPLNGKIYESHRRTSRGDRDECRPS